jgi:hypothetical protein
MAPLVFGPDLRPLNSPSSISLQPWIHPPIVLLAADHRTAGKSKRSQVVERFGVADGRILNHWIRAFSFIQRAASRKAA